MTGVRTTVGRSIRALPGGRRSLEVAFGVMTTLRRRLADGGGRTSLEARVDRARRHPGAVATRRRAARARLDARIRRDGLDVVIDELLDPTR